MRSKKVSCYVTVLFPEIKKKFVGSEFSNIIEEKSEFFTDEYEKTAVSYHVHENSERFICITIGKGEGRPRPKKVFNIKENIEEDNLRGEDQVEMIKQLFVMLDISSSKLYISDLGMKKLVRDWFTDKLKQNVIIEYDLNTKDFVDGLANVEKISFVEKINSTNKRIFGNDIPEDSILRFLNRPGPHYYGKHVNRINLTLKFNKHANDKSLFNKIKNLVENYKPNSNRELIIAGKTTEHFERIFNAGNVVDKINFICNVDETGFLNVKEVFSTLKGKINEQK